MASNPARNAGDVRFCTCCLAIYRQDFARCPLDGATLVVGANDPWIGLTVGTNYVIEELLGEGAMARVYRAHHRNFRDRRYAIKILIGDLAASKQMRARFALEAENAARLAHPNVVGVRDFGATDHGIDYMVMELVEGSTLGAILRRGPMDPERVITLTRQIAEGLDHAHDRGVIHRDLKPDNILVLAEREHEIARIADFGLALSKDSGTRLTTTGVVCTPAYAAPEQLRGEAIDLRVDLYALGVTMFEMLSGGILPFGGDVDASVTSKLVGEAPSVLMVAPNVPPALVSIVGRLLSPEPDRRPYCARAVIRALDQALTAPRLELKTEQLAPLRTLGDAAVVPSTRRSTANLRSGMRDVQASGEVHLSAQIDVRRSGNHGVRIDSLLPMRQRRVRRAAFQLLACGLTLAGVLAWADMRNPRPVRAEPALVATADEPLVSEPASETLSPVEEPQIPLENIEPEETLVPPPALTLTPMRLDDCDGTDPVSIESGRPEHHAAVPRAAERAPVRRVVARPAPKAHDHADEPAVAKPDEPTIAKPDDSTVAKPDEPTIAKPDEPTIAKPDEPTLPSAGVEHVEQPPPVQPGDEPMP